MKRKTAQGFTLIELLIVIAVLGILAVAVLSAINPIEQINRSRDTGSKSDAEQLIGAVDRFYAIRGFYPWTQSSTADYDLAWTAVGSAWSNGTTDVLSLLSSTATEELKQSFTERVTSDSYNTLYVYARGGQGDSFYACFVPKSGAFVTEAQDRCNGTLPADYPASACPATGDQFICLP